MKFDLQRFSGYRPILTELSSMRRATFGTIGRALSASWSTVRYNAFISLLCIACLLAMAGIFAAVPHEAFQKAFWFSKPEDIRTLVLVFASIGGAIIATLGLWFSGKRARAALLQSHITQESHFTDLLVRAGEQVSSENMLVRMVGIHSLERVARQSGQDQQAIALILAQFLQQNLPKVGATGADDLRRQIAETDIFQTRGDISAAIDALSRAMHYTSDIDGFSTRLTSVVLPNEGNLGDCENWEFIKCAFLDSELDGTRFQHCTFNESIFDMCTFNITWFNESTFSDVKFLRCNFPTTSFMNTRWDGGRFSNLYFGRSYFSGSTFIDVEFTECDFHRVDFRGSRFLGTRFIRCDFSGAYLDECVYQDLGNTFVECTYHHTNPPFAPADISLHDSKYFKAHDNPRGVTNTYWSQTVE